MASAIMQQRETCRAALLGNRAQLPSACCVNSSRTGRATAVRFRAARWGVHTKFAPDKTADVATISSRDEKASYAPGECIEVDESFEASEGAQLGSEFKIDKHIGSGSTANVFKLKPAKEGKSKGPAQVLKWSKSLPGARLTFQREWMLGRRLNAAARQDPMLNILLQTGPAVVSYSSDDKLQFRGAVLEGLNGKSLDKRLEEDSSFCDIDFLLACLQKVLTALDRADDLVGFRHGDLRVSNIMEHVLDPSRYEQLLQNPDTWRKQGYESAASAALDQGVLTLKLLDWGHSEIHESSSRKVLLSVEQDSATQHDQYLSSSGGDSGSSLALQRLPPAKGFIERIYTFWYKDKSDSWRLFHSLVPRLDGRTWPERKKREVMEFYELVSELQDVKLEAKFFNDTTIDASGKVRRLGANEPVFDRDAGDFVKLAELPGQDVTAKPQRGKWFRTLRDILLRAWSRWFSKRKTITYKDILRKMEKRGLLLLSDEQLRRP